MNGIFILSFDCEGKWGLLNKIDHNYRKLITKSNLLYSYKKILNILDKYEIKATFAFTGAFTMSLDEYLEKKDMIEDIIIENNSHLKQFYEDMRRGEYDGWFLPEAITLVENQACHEIAAHGFQHIPLSEAHISIEIFRKELEKIKNLTGFSKRENMTFIYPYNMIGYTDELAKAGYIGYRDNLYQPSGKNKLVDNFMQKLFLYFNEWNIISSAKNHSFYQIPVCIPPGLILNLRNGFWKTVPYYVIVKRWKNMVIDAAKSKKVLHLYSHPHNFITGKNMFNLFEEILKYVFQVIKRGELDNLTQKEYAEKIIKKNGHVYNNGSK